MLHAFQVIQQPGEPATLGAVVYVGGGTGAEVEHILACSPGRLIVAEGDPGLASALRKRFVGHPTVEVHECVLSPAAGQKDWIRYNLRRLNGCLPPTRRLRGAYPRLRELGRHAVRTEGLGPWLEGLGLDPAAGHRNVLMLDVAGIEGPLLESLAPHHLDAFPWVAVRGAAEPLFSGGSTLAQARIRMGQFGYRTVAEDPAEPLWPVELFYADPRARKLARANSQLALTKASLQARSTELKQERSRAEGLQRRVEGLASQVKARDEELAEARRQSQSLSREVERLKAEVATTHAGHDRAVALHAQQLSRLTGRADELARELARARSTVDHALKLQMLREGDLRDLRARHEAMTLQQRARDEMLAELERRLEGAREQLLRLTGEATAAGAAEGARENQGEGS